MERQITVAAHPPLLTITNLPFRLGTHLREEREVHWRHFHRLLLELLPPPPPTVSTVTPLRVDGCGLMNMCCKKRGR